MKKIDISTKKYPNTFALIDNEDYKYLNQWKWGLCKSKTSSYISRKKQKNLIKCSIKLHREIIKPPKGMVVDHINHNILDNRKCNLRICTRSQNNMNMLPNKGKHYKGIHFRKDEKKWKAYISKNYKRIQLGQWKTEIEAARAYNCAARILFGKFAYLNSI